jgi:hypothetical protein
MNSFIESAIRPIKKFIKIKRWEKAYMFYNYCYLRSIDNINRHIRESMGNDALRLCMRGKEEAMLGRASAIQNLQDSGYTAADLNALARKGDAKYAVIARRSLDQARAIRRSEERQAAREAKARMRGAS